MIMSITNEYISHLRDYVSSIVGSQISITHLPSNERKRLPLVITGAFELLTGNIWEIPIIYLVEKNEGEHTPQQIEKLIAIVKRLAGRDSVYVTSNIASYNQQRLAKRHVNFIVVGRQMFVPSLLLDIKRPVHRDTDIAENIAPFTQLLLLYHLEKEKMDGLSAMDISKKFDVSYATANRAFRWFSEKNLANTEGSKEHKITFLFEGKQLWAKALPFLASPISKVAITDKLPTTALTSGINALAEYTMINHEDKRRYAISKNEYKHISKNANNQYGDIEIEIWKYAPHILCKNDTVDKLSLYLSLKDSQDERVQIELEHLIDDMPW